MCGCETVARRKRVSSVETDTSPARARCPTVVGRSRTASGRDCADYLGIWYKPFKRGFVNENGAVFTRCEFGKMRNAARYDDAKFPGAIAHGLRVR